MQSKSQSVTRKMYIRTGVGPATAKPPRMRKAMLGPLESIDIAALSECYRSGSLTPSAMVAGILERVARRGDDKVWIHLLPSEELRLIARKLETAGPAGKPLYGIPFAIKDN